MDTNSSFAVRLRAAAAPLIAAFAILLASPVAATAEYATPIPPLETPPTLGMQVGAVRATSGDPHSLRVPIVVDEPVRLDVSARGRTGVSRSVEFARQAGRAVLVVPLHRRGALVPAFDRRRGIPLRLQLVATDADGNHDVLTSNVRVLPPTGYVPSTQLLSPMPGYAITSGFGPRWGRLHAGVDIPAPTGTPIHAARAGVVTAIEHDGGYGLATTIDHGAYSTFYAHQSGVSVHVGQRVERGQSIGAVGTTGSTTGAHLHFEVHVGGVAHDPMGWL